VYTRRQLFSGEYLSIHGNTQARRELAFQASKLRKTQLSLTFPRLLPFSYKYEVGIASYEKGL
jgi:hypothetical protein